jgi:hypothetical protein
MNVTYNEGVDQVSESNTLLQQATQCLEEVLGPSSGQVNVDWALTKDAKGRAVYTLRLSDQSGSVTDQFGPDELRCGRPLRYRLNRLWGDLLQERSHQQLRRLTEGGGEPEE